MTVYTITYTHRRGWQSTDIVMDAASDDEALAEFRNWYTVEGEEPPADATAEVFAEPPQTLADLCEALNNWHTIAHGELAGLDQTPRQLWPGAPMAHGRLDMTSLPTFGGEEPSNTTGIWSWDATHYLMTGDANLPFALIPRDEWDNQ